MYLKCALYACLFAQIFLEKTNILSNELQSEPRLYIYIYIKIWRQCYLNKVIEETIFHACSQNLLIFNLNQEIIGILEESMHTKGERRTGSG